MILNLVPSTWFSTVGMMLNVEAAPEPPTISSCVNTSAGVLTGVDPAAVQIRAGNDVAPSHWKRRGAASILGWPIIAWLGKLREKVPMTVPSRGAWLNT